MAYTYAARVKFDTNVYRDSAGNNWTAVGTPLFETGRFGGSAPRFSNTFYYTLPANAQPLLNLGTKDFTITTWTKMSPSNYPYATILNGGRHLAYQRFSTSYGGNGVPRLHYGGADAGMLVAKTRVDDDKWHYVTLTRSNLVDRIFIDGKLEGTCDASGFNDSLTNVGARNYRNINFTGNGTGFGTELNGDGNSYFCGLVDDFVVINGAALWTADFTPPTSYLFAPRKLYRVNDDVYGVTGGALAKLGTGWSALSVGDRVTLFKSAELTDAYASELAALGKFTAMELNTEDDTLDRGSVRGVPAAQFVHETVDVDLKLVSNLDWLKVNVGTTNFVAGGGVLRVVASRDSGRTWWAYSSTSATWTQVLDTTNAADGVVVDQRFTPTPAGLAKLKASGLTVDQMATAPFQAWTIDAGFKRIRVGVYLEVSSTSDVALVDNVKLQYDGLGTWRLAANYTHYTVDTGNFSHTVTWLSAIGGKRVKVNY